MSKTKIIPLPCIFIILLLLNSTFMTSRVFAYSKEEAKNAITAAQNSLIECYKAAAETQKAGANITELLDDLNKAGELFSRAFLAYKTGNYSLAIKLASESQGLLENFVSKANTLKEVAIEQRRWDFMVNVVGSSIGAVAIIIMGFGLWTLLNRKVKEEKRR